MEYFAVDSAVRLCMFDVLKGFADLEFRGWQLSLRVLRLTAKDEKCKCKSLIL